MSRRYTISDIARLAGVSKSTVSRVLNQRSDVDDSTRQRVLQVVEEVGFVPSVSAAGLAGGRSHLIGVLLPSFTWPFISDILLGVSEVIASTRYELVVYSINSEVHTKNKQDTIDRILTTKLTAGLLAILPGQSSRYIARLHEHGWPTVLVDDQEIPQQEGSNIPWIGVENKEGGYMATRHLIQLGHRRIAHITGPRRFLCARERYEGYCQALEEAGIAVDPELVIEGDFTPAGGQRAAYTLLTLPADRRPTAIFAGSDTTAFGVMAVAEKLGMRVPADLALVGFDDVAASADMVPPLTTVRQPFYEMGQLSIKLLLSQLGLPGFPPLSSPDLARFAVHHTSGEDGLIHIRLATSLVVRASCGSAQSRLALPVSPPESVL